MFSSISTSFKKMFSNNEIDEAVVEETQSSDLAQEFSAQVSSFDAKTCEQFEFNWEQYSFVLLDQRTIIDEYTQSVASAQLSIYALMLAQTEVVQNKQQAILQKNLSTENYSLFKQILLFTNQATSGQRAALFKKSMFRIKQGTADQSIALDFYKVLQQIFNCQYRHTLQSSLMLQTIVHMNDFAKIRFSEILPRKNEHYAAYLVLMFMNQQSAQPIQIDALKIEMKKHNVAQVNIRESSYIDEKVIASYGKSWFDNKQAIGFFIQSIDLIQKQPIELRQRILDILNIINLECAGKMSIEHEVLFSVACYLIGSEANFEKTVKTKVAEPSL